MARRTKLLVLALVAVLAAAAAWIVLPERTSDAGARAAAQEYVDLLASGDEDGLERLWAMTLTESPGALRTAGELLAAAPERIEVVSVGEPTEVDRADVPFRTVLEDFVEVEVRYRLDGEEHLWPVVLAKLLGESGADAGDWRVATPMTGSVDWAVPSFTDAPADVYVGTTRVVRRPLLLGGGDEDVQPLYPAVYRAQRRLDPYFVSTGPGTLVVTAGAPVLPPDLPLQPTPATRDTLARQVRARFAACPVEAAIFRTCPVRDIVERAGVEVWRDRGWWRGLTKEPTVTVDSEGLTLSGGVFRFRGPDGERQVRFRGTGDYLLGNQSWTPELLALDLEEAR